MAHPHESLLFSHLKWIQILFRDIGKYKSYNTKFSMQFDVKSSQAFKKCLEKVVEISQNDVSSCGLWEQMLFFLPPYSYF